MELMLFALWFAIMCGFGIRIYLAHQSLKKNTKSLKNSEPTAGRGALYKRETPR